MQDKQSCKIYSEVSYSSLFAKYTEQWSNQVLVKCQDLVD